MIIFMTNFNVVTSILSIVLVNKHVYGFKVSGYVESVTIKNQTRVIFRL